VTPFNATSGKMRQTAANVTVASSLVRFHPYDGARIGGIKSSPKAAAARLTYTRAWKR
jgi:hypothetical protein